jgi:hypothetical protein
MMMRFTLAVAIGILGLGGVASATDINRLPAAMVTGLPPLGPHGELNQTTLAQFWNLPQSAPATTAGINRTSPRILSGGAVPNDGNYYPSGCTGCVGGFTDLDWLGRVFRTTVGGAAGLGGNDLNFAQGGFLTDPTSSAASQAVPIIGLLGAAETSHSLTASTPRGVESLGINDPQTGQSPPVWASYSEAHALSATAGNTYTYEAEIRNSGASVVWNPYTQNAHATTALETGCGAGLSATGQFNCTVAHYVAANPMPFNVGTIYLNGSIAAATDGSYPAIEMPQNYSMQWWNAGSPAAKVASIYSDTFNNLHLDQASGGAVMPNGNIVMPSGNQINWGAAGTANIGGISSGVILLNAGSNQFRIDTGLITINTHILAPLATPSSSSAACATGTSQDDANYHYVCVATNTWKRVALSSF